jgi:DNA-binding CsgD family transcriptional regulator
VGVAEATRGRDVLLAADRAEASLATVCDDILAAFRIVASFIGGAVMTTDPDTLLPTGGVVAGFDPSLCVPFWDNELLDPDFNKFHQIAHLNPPLATLVEAVDGDLARSPRFAKLYAELPAADELRVAFVAGSSCLAVGVFVRPESAGPFPAEELADVRDLLPVATAVLRRATGRVEHASSLRPPVVVILDAAGDIRSITSGGRAVLDSLRSKGADEQSDLPAHIRAAATRVRWSRNPAQLATRVRDQDGMWMRVHVAPMEASDGSVAVTIERARPNDLLAIVLDSYGLTDRETEIVLHLMRGASAKEIAQELMISAHTVRDHVKAIYEKAVVNGRGELMARLFADHVVDEFHDAIHHVA